MSTVVRGDAAVALRREERKNMAVLIGGFVGSRATAELCLGLLGRLRGQNEYIRSSMIRQNRGG